MELDVEALLESAAKAQAAADADNRSGRRHERTRDTSRDRDVKRSDRKRDHDGDIEIKSEPLSSANGRSSNRRDRSRSPDKDRGLSRRERPRESLERGGGDFYRGEGRPRTSRSVSPDGSRYYRPSGARGSGRGERDEREAREPRGRIEHEDRNRRPAYRGGRDGRDRDHRRGTPGDRMRREYTRSNTPPLNEDERDRRTVFVQQLAARLRTKELIAFFAKVGPVKEAQIVKDRVSGRSKGQVTSINIIASLIVSAALAMSNSGMRKLLQLQSDSPVKSCLVFP